MFNSNHLGQKHEFFSPSIRGSKNDAQPKEELTDREQSKVAAFPSAEEDGEALDQPSDEIADTPSQDDASAVISEEDAVINAALELGVTRPLEGDPYEILQPGVGHLRVAHATDQGMVRTNNQDSLYRFFASSSSVDEIPDFGYSSSPMVWAVI